MPNQRSDAEHAIASALYVLGCILHKREDLARIAQAIEFYAAGNDEPAAVLARAVAKGREVKRVPCGSTSVPMSLEDASQMLVEARRKRLMKAIQTAGALV